MSQRLELDVEMREATGTSVAKKLRREGIVPGVIYGGGQRNYPVQLNEKKFSDMLKGLESENVLVDLKVEGAENPNKLVLIQAVQHNTLTGRINHVDFQAVKEDDQIRATVPIHLTGEPTGVKLGGLLEHQVHQLEVQCLPKDLPESLSFDVTELGLGSALHVGDVSLPEGVSVTVGGQVVIALVAETRTAKAAAAADED
ncbi:MAG: 50S ribosomal protein L25 [Verrucomicrobiota bacterium]